MPTAGPESTDKSWSQDGKTAGDRIVHSFAGSRSKRRRYESRASGPREEALRGGEAFGVGGDDFVPLLVGFVIDEPAGGVGVVPGNGFGNTIAETGGGDEVGDEALDL